MLMGTLAHCAPLLTAKIVGRQFWDRHSKICHGG